MGFAITWCAVPEEKADEFFHRLGLSPTGKTEGIPESLIVTARLDTGWRVMWYNKYGCPFLRPQDLASISVDQDVIMCLVEEHVMASSSEMWSGGKRKWWLSHEGEDGPKGLSTDGDLPASFPAIRKDMEQSQLAEGGDSADIDYIFEIPLKVAQTIVGFKHDEECSHLLDRHFIVMSQTTPEAGFFRRLFRRKE
ncbi:MAG TPA: hypothetical protein VLZ10_10105 [Thermodesulfobacteriota bacterium]|nr:hypothetical protein [Thermodesulfobacteriota bacterium]